MDIPESYAKVMVLAGALGIKRICDMDGCWEHAVDERWWIAVNGHREPVANSHGGKVDPYRIFVEYNGWPAGIIDPAGGIIAEGEAANEATFIAALDAAIIAAGGEVPRG